MVKMETSEGLFAKLLSVGIVRIVVMLLSKSLGAFLQSRRRARASRPCAVLGHHDARGNRARAGPLGCQAELITVGPFSSFF